jgi:hypothetical protein
MTATVELDDLVLNKAKNLSGISDEEELASMVFGEFVHGQKMLRSTDELVASFKGNPFWDDYDPRA